MNRGSQEPSRPGKNGVFTMAVLEVHAVCPQDASIKSTDEQWPAVTVEASSRTGFVHSECTVRHRSGERQPSATERLRA